MCVYPSLLLPVSVAVLRNELDEIVWEKEKEMSIRSLRGPNICAVVRLHYCLVQMSEKMEQSEKLAEEGLVDEAQALLAEVSPRCFCDD